VRFEEACTNKNIERSRLLTAEISRKESERKGYGLIMARVAATSYRETKKEKKKREKE